MHDEGLKNQIEMVKELRSLRDRNEDEQRISAIWEASDARFTNWENGKGDYEPIFAEVNKLDELMRTNEVVKETDEYIKRVTAYLYYSQINGITNVIDFDKVTDLDNSNNMILDVSTTGLSLPGRDYYTESNFDTKRAMFKKHLENILAMVRKYEESKDGFSGTSMFSKDWVDQILSFEHELAKNMMTKAQARHYSKYYTTTTLTKLYEAINELKSLPEKQDNFEEKERDLKFSQSDSDNAKLFFESMYTHFDFRSILKANREKFFLGEIKVANPPAEDGIMAFDGDGLRRILLMVMNPANAARYRSFLQYKVIKKFYAFCTKEMDDEFFDFFSRKLQGQNEQKSNDKRSIQLVNDSTGEMLGKIFVAKYFSESSKKDIRGMIGEVTKIMNDSIKANDWLTETTKEKALVKLSKFGVKIGYPDKWKDYSKLQFNSGDSLYHIVKTVMQWKLQTDFFDKLNSVVDKTEWHMSPQTVNAYFNPQVNEIVFPAAILQPPFYHTSGKTVDFDIEEESAVLKDEELIRMATNFGGIGAVIAHEITHGYDDKGREFDGDGMLNDWWTKEDEQLFNAKCDLMSSQASAYSFIDKEDADKKYTLNPKLTMGENLADLGGMSLAIKALKMKAAEYNANMTGEEMRSLDRVFCKSWANIWKQNTKKDFKLMCLVSDPHSPPDFRCNLVKNIQEFYDAFGVKESDPMYIEQKVRVRMW